jgi:hypothetical protein
MTTLALARLFDRMSDRVSLARGLLAATGVLITAVYVGMLLTLMRRAPFDTWGALIIGPVIVLATIPTIARQAKREQSDGLFWLLLAALVLKMLGALLRVYVVSDVYGGEGDSLAYHSEGTRIAVAFRAGDFHTGLPTLTDTDFISFLTGLIYTVTGSTFVGGFMIFSWLGFWGLFYFYRAFTIALPDAKRSSYAILLFFLPSLLYWPSSIGKESWMLFTLGIVSYGAALVFTYRPHGYLVLMVGLAGTAAVRPHVTLLVFAALFGGSLLRRRSWRESRLGLLGRMAGLAVLIALGAVILAQTASFFNVDNIDQGSVEQVLDRTDDQSSDGDAAFDSPRLSSPSEYPYAVVSVLFRPFPWEAGNPQALVAAAEGLVLMGLFAFSLPRLWRIPWYAVRTPYVAFALAYTAMFVLAFSAIGNFGLLTRQRTQVLPLVLVLLAVPAGIRRSVDASVDVEVLPPTTTTTRARMPARAKRA